MKKQISDKLVYICFLVLIIFMFLACIYEAKNPVICDEEFGVVRSVYYDSGFGRHNYVLNVNGKRIETYEPYEIGDKYILSTSNCKRIIN